MCSVLNTCQGPCQSKDLIYYNYHKRPDFFSLHYSFLLQKCSFYFSLHWMWCLTL
uniref:Uncharacterized protein n=1 Tax=Anguilla anguilla TaxID=7936 RepID=A0A0E9WGW3_ANGAN